MSLLIFDTECTGLRWFDRHKPFMLGFCHYNGENLSDVKVHTLQWPCFPSANDPKVIDVIYDDFVSNSLYQQFCDLYYDPNVEKVAANSKYDIHMLEEHLRLPANFENAGKIHDVLIMAWCCNNLETSYGLKYLAKKYVRYPDEDEEIIKKKVISLRKTVKKVLEIELDSERKVEQDYWLINFINKDDDSVRIYNRNDVWRTLKLYHFYQQGLQKLNRQQTYEDEIALIPALYKMEKRGIRFDYSKCKADLLDVRYKYNWALAEVRAKSNNPKLNVDSPKQLQEILYQPKEKGGFGLPILKQTKTGNASTDLETLRKLKGISDRYETNGFIPALIRCKETGTTLEYASEYLDNCSEEKWYNANDLLDLNKLKAIYPSFNQITYDHFSTTGRLTSSDPNLQNIFDPEKSKSEGLDLRKYFIAREGYLFIVFDYKQIELRIFAERCAGKLMDAFLQNRDPHDETRRNVPYLAQLDKETGRKIAKNTNFTVINMGGANVLYEKYGIPLNEGEEVIKGFHEAYPETKDRQYKIMKEAIANGFIRSISGRKINIDLTKNDDGKYMWAYKATAYDIQGSASDILKRSLRRLYHFCKDNKQYDIHPLLNIHDELVIECNKDHVSIDLVLELKTIVEHNRDWMKIATPVDVKISNTTFSSKDKIELVV